MEVIVHSRPNILIETVELVCAWFNQINPKHLTATVLPCIPAAEIDRMLQLVCGDLDRESPKLRFYFQGLPADDPSAEALPVGCVGGIVVRSSLYGEVCALEEYRAYLHKGIMCNPNRRFNSYNGYTLGVTTNSQYENDFYSLADELNGLNMTDVLRLRLAEALSDYHFHVDQICDILEPLARRLEPLLVPWIEKMQPRVTQWRELLFSEDGLESFCSRLNTNLDGMERVYVIMSMFYPQAGIAQYIHEKKDLLCSLGLTLPLSKGAQSQLTDLDMAGLRLLTGKDRIDMLRVMFGNHMSQKEIARELGINPGTVSRDLSSMTMTHLLKMKVVDGYRTYVTNMEYLELLTERLLDYIRQGH